jgi:hypothetical protein
VYNTFRRDMQSNTTILLSRTQQGLMGNQQTEGPFHCCLSANGKIAVFSSGASNLAPGDTNNNMDVFVSIDGAAPVGAGTPGCQGTHGIGPVNLPKIGTASFGIRTDKAPASALGLCLISDTANVAGTDYFNIGILFHTDLFLSAEVLSFDTLSNASGVGSCAVGIPPAPGLVGTDWTAQTIWAWSSCALPPFNLSSSPGLTFVIQA